MFIGSTWHKNVPCRIAPDVDYAYPVLVLNDRHDCGMSDNAEGALCQERRDRVLVLLGADSTQVILPWQHNELCMRDSLDQAARRTN